MSHHMSSHQRCIDNFIHVKTLCNASERKWELLVNNVTSEEVGEIRQYLHDISSKALISYDGKGSMIITERTNVTICVGLFFDWIMNMYNFNFACDEFHPMVSYGSFEVRLGNGAINEPAAQYDARNRKDCASNVVVEVFHKSTQTVEHFNYKLRSYILNSSDIMLSVGVHVIERQNTSSESTFEAIFVVYQRNISDDSNTADLRHLISFGTEFPDLEILTAWTTATGCNVAGFVPGGVGLNDGAVPIDATYLPTLPFTHLVCTDNLGLSFAAELVAEPPTAGPDGDMVINLYELQKTIGRRIMRVR